MPGVDTTKTLALNEAAISLCNLVRYVPDRTLGGLVQKLGGWTKYCGQTMTSIVRALCAWADTNAATYLGIGMEAFNYQAQLAYVTGASPNSVHAITPRTVADNITPNFTTAAGSNLVVVDDGTVTASNYDSVFIATHVSVGGAIMFGLYQCTAASAGAYTIAAADIFGNPFYATSSTSPGVVAAFTTSRGTSIVNVNLPAHNFQVGNTYPVLIPTVVGGVTIFADYIVQAVVDADNFTINVSRQASATATVSINGGNVANTYYIGFGSVPAGSGYGVGGYGRGGYGSGTSVTPSSGLPIYATDWFLDNWGEILISCPITSETIPFIPTAASGTGSHATLTFSGSYVVPIGGTLIVSGMVPSAYNGTVLVTASSAGSVTYASTATGAMTTAGAIAYYATGYSALYQWDPLSGQPIATVIPNCPVVNSGFFVAMPQRQIIAWGSSFTGDKDPLLVRWCDVEDFTAWIASTTNQAGSFRLTKGSRIVGGIQGPQQSLIWTDVGLWAMQYIGQPYIYSFNEIGAGCGMIAPKAAGTLNGGVYWMGPSQFYMLAGNGVEPLPCPVWDVAFQDLDTSNLSKIRVAVNSEFGEIAWYYPTIGSGEVTSYVKYNVMVGAWDYGTLSRTAWINQSVLGPPIGANPDDLDLYQHETSPDADGDPLLASFQTGYFALRDGDSKTFIDKVWPDMKWGYFNGTQNASVNLTFYAADFPGQAPTVYGPYVMTQNTQYLVPRIRARLLSIGISSNDVGTWWRLGNIRYRATADGKY